MKVVILEKLKIYMHGHTHMDVIIYDFSKQKMKTAYFLIFIVRFFKAIFFFK